MWVYEKRLQFPINIKETNAKLAQDIISQYGGPDGEMSASMRYLSQRYSMPDKKVKAALTDIGTEELAHLEMICAIVHQLTRDLTPEQIEGIRLRQILCRPHTRHSGLRRPAELLGALQHSSPKVIRSQIFMKIWLQRVRLYKDNIEVLKESSR